MGITLDDTAPTPPAAQNTFEGDFAKLTKTIEGNPPTTYYEMENGNYKPGAQEAGAFDSIQGRIDNDIIHGLAGNDALAGMGGKDLIEGGEGNDLLLGGWGADTINGGGGVDVIFGSGVGTLRIAYLCDKAEFQSGGLFRAANAGVFSMSSAA